MTDLMDRVCLIIKAWGNGDTLDEDRIVKIANSLYEVKPEEVRKAILENLREGKIRGKYYVSNE